jgi:hypothetical protein
MRNDLFEPTIRMPQRTGSPPWRLSSQGYVAFFGGVIAGATVALLNARRLGVAARDQLVIVAASVFGLLVAFSIMVAWDPDRSGQLRMVDRLVAVVVYLAHARIQRPADRSFQLRGGEHASLWLPGLAMVIGCGVAEALLIAGVVAVFP